MINIKNFTTKSSTIILGYLNPKPVAFSKKPPSSVAKLTEVFNACWEGIIWASQLDLEEEDAKQFLSQILYFGSKLQPHIKTVSDGVNIRPCKGLNSQVMVKTLQKTRFVHLDSLHVFKTYPLFIDIARSSRGRRLLNDLNLKMIAKQKCLVIFAYKGNDSSCAIPDHCLTFHSIQFISKMKTVFI
jgi:hypothetical protein